MEAPLEELIAVVSDFEATVDKPVYNPDQVKEIADFLEESVEPRKHHLISGKKGGRE